MTTTRQRRGSVDTSSQILDIAERLVQSRGFNGFSYADVSAELKISKASLHYHFPGKAELGEALIGRYAARFARALTEIDQSSVPVTQKLDAYATIYADVLRAGRMCLCGMLAADYETLPLAMRDAVVGFFDYNVAWLTRLLEEGQRDGSLHLGGSPKEEAQTIVSSLEGAMLVARPYADITRFQAVATRLLAGFAPPGLEAAAST